jgi:hypothetical protein
VLAVSIGASIEKTPQTSDSSLSQREEDKMVAAVGPILRRHLHTVKEMNQFFIETGAVVTAAGAAFYAAGVWSLRKSKSDSRINASA